MRNNQPVTDNEYVMPDGAQLASMTDLKGIITYCNDEFIEASGFSAGELIGAPHNLVRHPDMPEAAFADLWRTLKAGKPWTGIVKNRRKNGGFYWVEANVTPVYEAGEPNGYMSVRYKPTREQIDAAERLYRDMRTGRCKLGLHEGSVVRPGMLSGLRYRLRDWSVKLKLGMLAGMLMLSVALLAGYDLYGMSVGKLRSDESMAQMSARMHAVDLARQAQLHFGEQVQAWDNILLRSHDAEQFGSYARKFDEKSAQVRDELRALKSALIQSGGNTDGADALLLSHEGLMVNYRNALKSFDVNRRETSALVEGETRGMERGTTELMDGFAARMKTDADAYLVAISASHDQIGDRHTQTVLAFAALALLLGSVFSMLLVRGIIAPCRVGRHALIQMSEGNYRANIGTQGNDELGIVLNAMKSMQIRLGFDVTDAKRIADANLRIRIGLDNVSTGVMIADTDYNIIYLNKAAGELMQAAEADIRKALPNFNAAGLQGSSIDVFHKNAAHQRAMLERLSGTYRSQIVVGGRTFAIAANPVVNGGGHRLGTVMEWTDRTAEMAVEKEVADIVDGAVQGDFSKRIALQGKAGFFKQLGEGINRLMETSDQALREIVRMLDALAHGDLTDRISNEYRGTFGQLKNDANATAEKLGEIVAQIKDATDTINTAAQEIAAGNTDLSQRTEEQASSLEETASSMEELTSTVKQNAENAKQANQLAIGASDVAGKGGAVVSQVVTTMESINASSRKIVDIIAVIDGIAFQTNILALNAAVEAARAGEQGRGFAVVAGEVRNLAQRSAAAAKEIKHLIEDSVGKVGEGSKLVAQAGQTMAEIVTSIKHVTDIMAEITAASAEQSQGIEQVNQAIAQMDEVTQQNAALVEQAAAAAESLEEQAQNLAVSVGTFKMDDKGGTTNARRAVHAAASKSAHAKAVAHPAGRQHADDDEWQEF